jgi:hypothetical protein
VASGSSSTQDDRCVQFREAAGWETRTHASTHVPIVHVTFPGQHVGAVQITLSHSIMGCRTSRWCEENQFWEEPSHVQAALLFSLEPSTKRTGCGGCVQDLLWRSVDAPLEMDKQGGMGNIPMHQVRPLNSSPEKKL